MVFFKEEGFVFSFEFELGIKLSMIMFCFEGFFVLVFFFVLGGGSMYNYENLLFDFYC